MKGWLAPVTTPHVYRHLDERYHSALHELVQPQTMTQVALALGCRKNTVTARSQVIIRELMIEGSSTGWRVALTRLYYGVDPCWCQ